MYVLFNDVAKPHTSSFIIYIIIKSQLEIYEHFFFCICNWNNLNSNYFHFARIYDIKQISI